jgi:hypothetical protein
MTILNREELPKCGPYIYFVYHRSPIVVEEESWPPFSEYKQDVFFELADDLLGCLCSLTKQYSPFGTYDLTHLGDPTSLRRLADAFQQWAAIIESLGNATIAKQCQFLFSDSGKSHRKGDSIKRDLLETLHFIIEKLKTAEELGHTVTIVGI